ncbi:recombinase family protein [Deltaproteobacteria bacterium OttesenSCG-928-M10]|nr:recombinase family protein [Deltaproteobacteria bacterium OttesenSCG-928-M10]
MKGAEKVSNNQSKNSAGQGVAKTSPQKTKRRKAAQASSSSSGLRVGYARVSTDDQNLALQQDALGAAGCRSIYEENASGKSAARPELEACLKALRPGDTLVVWRLDRLGRSLGDLVATVTGLDERGVGFESLTEKIDTNSAAGRLIFHVFAALAEFERNLIRERTVAGLAAARARGRIGGRKPKVDSKMEKKIKAMKAGGIPISTIAKDLGLARSTIYNYLAS